MTMRMMKIVPILAMLAGLSACGRRHESRDLTPYIETMIRELGDADCTARRNAATALGVLGPRAAKAVPALECAQGDEEYMVRVAATEALSRIRPGLAMARSGR